MLRLITRTRLSVVLALICASAIPLVVPGASMTLLTSTNPALTNGSIEAGTSGPEGWTLFTGASWAADLARSGSRSLVGGSKSDRRVCESVSVAVESGADYRLEGWIQCSEGGAQLGVGFLIERSRVISHKTTPRVRAGQAWQYVAVEANAAQAVRARVWFRVKGRAVLDDVALASARMITWAKRFDFGTT